DGPPLHLRPGGAGAGAGGCVPGGVHGDLPEPGQVPRRRPPLDLDLSDSRARREPPGAAAAPAGAAGDAADARAPACAFDGRVRADRAPAPSRRSPAEAAPEEADGLGPV